MTAFDPTISYNAAIAAAERTVEFLIRSPRSDLDGPVVDAFIVQIARACALHFIENQIEGCGDCVKAEESTAWARFYVYVERRLVADDATEEDIWAITEPIWRRWTDLARQLTDEHWQRVGGPLCLADDERVTG